MSEFIRAVGGLKNTVIYTDADERHFRFSGGTWAWRNHNPGNVWAGKISKKHNQIGKIHGFAIFADDESGHESLLETLIKTYGNASIHEMIYSYAPPEENPTKTYERLLRKNTGINDDTPIKKFTKIQFEELWKTIQLMEGYKVGEIIEIYQISDVQITEKDNYQYCLNNNEWISEAKCINLATEEKVELEVCLSKSGNQFLRTPPNSLFQKKLGDLMCKK